VQAQAAITSTHGHPRLIWPVRPKFNKTFNLKLLTLLCFKCQFNLVVKYDIFS